MYDVIMKHDFFGKWRSSAKPNPQWDVSRLYKNIQMYKYLRTIHQIIQYFNLLCWITTAVLGWQFRSYLCTNVSSSKQKQSKSPFDLWFHWCFIPVLQLLIFIPYETFIPYELGCQKYPTLHFSVNKHGCAHHNHFAMT